MSVAIEEQLDLSDTGTPPCSMYFDQDGEHCGEPSVVRVRVSCHSCGFVECEFLCGDCFYETKHHIDISCLKCESQDYDWVVI